MGTEGGKDQVSPRTQRSVEHCEIAVPIGGGDHEVEDGAIVPEVEATAEVVAARIGLNPGHLARGFAQLGFGALQRLGGYVGDRHVAVPAPQQFAGQPRCATAHIEDRGVQGQGGLSDQRQRGIGRRLGPAQLLGAAFGVSPLPVGGRLVKHRPDCEGFKRRTAGMSRSTQSPEAAVSPATSAIAPP